MPGNPLASERSMDEPTTLAELLTPDTLTGAFWPSGLSGVRMPPQDSLHYLRDSIALARLIEAVPEAVRNSFARVRKTYLYGLVEYDLFTVADDDARLILEGALRARFLTYYDGQVPVIKQGEETLLNVSSFDDVREADKRKYQRRTGDGPRRLPVSMASLLRWARRELLLVGQRSTITDKTAVDLRHHVAHPSGYHLLGPVDAARTLCRVAEYINRLWGADTPGGRTFPAPARRVPRVAAIAADGSFVTFSSVRSVCDGDPSVRDGTFAVYLASPQEELCGIEGQALDFSHRPGFQCTNLPCELLWGPGPLAELLPNLDRYEDVALNDLVQHLDRLFVIRVDGETIDLPRSPADFEAADEMQGEWHVLRADYPNDALWHVRQHRDKTPSELHDGHCPDCPVTELGRFPDRIAATECVQQAET
jgi:hypothetical protein